ncbi:Gfo/Idh/MocA family protein [Fontivita pretiosa]|uniref:Gfo/Idh/MocA family protein n=1 Tax=Fontivita pretiosa TaxID=2989684 RepID=UPI003D1697B8
MARQSPRSSGQLNLAIIGMGHRASHFARLLCELDQQIRIAAAADEQPAEQVRARMHQARVPDADGVALFSDADALLEHADDFHALLIATTCAAHAPIAVKAAGSGLPLFLEKPVAISWEQLRALAAAYAGHEHRVVVSFPLRLTIHVQTAIDIIRRGRLGVINQVQAVNNVPYGGVYYGQWYRDYDKTGGLWLQKATHDFDYITHMLASRPTMIAAMHSRLAYGGDRPAGLRCCRCDQTQTCPESPAHLAARGDDGGTLNSVRPCPDADHACTFSSSILHQDAGSALIMYESGVHACYAQNFISRRQAGRRGARVIGYDATLEFDWYSDLLSVIEHHRGRIEQLEVRAFGSHGGGDEQLAMNFIDVIRGRAASRAPLSDGLLSAAMCLAARQAANSGIAQPITPPHSSIEQRRPGPPVCRGASTIEPD